MTFTPAEMKRLAAMTRQELAVELAKMRRKVAREQAAIRKLERRLQGGA